MIIKLLFSILDSKKTIIPSHSSTQTKLKYMTYKQIGWTPDVHTTLLLSVRQFTYIRMARLRVSSTSQFIKLNSNPLNDQHHIGHLIQQQTLNKNLLNLRWDVLINLYTYIFTPYFKLACLLFLKLQPDWLGASVTRSVGLYCHLCPVCSVH